MQVTQLFGRKQVTFPTRLVALSCCRKYKTNFKFITMKTSTKPTSNEAENGNKSKPLLCDVFIRPFKSSFTGKLLKKGIEIGCFNCIEEFTDARFKIITNNLNELYSFVFDFDEEKKEYKMDNLGKWNFDFPEYENPCLNMNIGIRNFQIDGVFKYYEAF
jgi:hypothetical protein